MAEIMNATNEAAKKSYKASPPSIFAGGSPLHEPISIFLLQAILIIIISRTLHFALSKGFKSPRVVSEVLAGIIVGRTSLFNVGFYQSAIWPQGSGRLFYTISQFGLILVFFMIGLELDPSSLFKLKKTVLLSSIFVFLLPFLSSFGVSWYLYAIFGSGYAQAPFLLMTSVCMSVTGFSVVYRMLTVSKWYNTALTELTTDITNFNAILLCVFLMYVIPYAENSQFPDRALGIFAALAGTVLIFWWILGKIMTGISNLGTSSESLSQLSVLLTLVMVFAFSWFTHAMGANAIFGALLVGLKTPHDHRFAIKIAEKLEDIVMILFVPLYYGFIGIEVNFTSLR